MIWTELDTWIVITGVLGAMSCALVGSFLVLRKMSMMGDAISHAVLPGLAIAFLVSGSRGSVAMFAGAAVVGVLTALFTQWIHRLGKVDESASMGVVFTAMFAAGLILMVQAADKVDLDPGCVLYGSIELVPLDVVRMFGLDVPRAVAWLGGTLLFDGLFVAFFYKELRISAFDSALSNTLGINAQVMHYLLMTVVAVTTVASFESAGSILVIAMLIVPGAAAHLLTDRYGWMLVISVTLAAVAAVLGHLSAITIPTWFGFSDTSSAGMMAVAAGCLFVLAALFGPRHGVFSRILHQMALTARIATEDVLGVLYRLEESGWASRPTNWPRTLGHALRVRPALARLALRRLSRERFIVSDGSGYRLTTNGRRQAQQVVRSHRLWESYLAKHFELPVDHLHESAERTEHYITPPMQEAIAADLDHVAIDPHGQSIPSQNPSNAGHADPSDSKGEQT